MHLDMRFWGSRQGEFSEVFVIFVPALCQFSLASRLERLDHLSIYVSIYVARSRTHPQIQFHPLLLLPSPAALAPPTICLGLLTFL